MVLFLLVSRLIYWSSRVWPWFVFTRRTVATPLASLLGVKETVRLKAPHNPTLESYYCKTTKNPTQVCVCVQISPHHVFKKTSNLNLFLLLFCTSDFHTESQQADGLLWATGAALVQTTEEPGQTKFAQKISRSQVNRVPVSLWSGAEVSPQYEDVSDSRPGPLCYIYIMDSLGGRSAAAAASVVSAPLYMDQQRQNHNLRTGGVYNHHHSLGPIRTVHHGQLWCQAPPCQKAPP